MAKDKSKTTAKGKGQPVTMTQAPRTMAKPAPETPVESTAKTTKKDDDKQPAWSHESKKRCVGNDPQYPNFLGKKCNRLMKPDGTTDGGKFKWWKCPNCCRRIKTVGTKV